MSPENISANFGESHHCKNLKFKNVGESQRKTVTQLVEMQVSLQSELENLHSSYELFIFDVLVRKTQAACK